MKSLVIFTALLIIDYFGIVYAEETMTISGVITHALLFVFLTTYIMNIVKKKYGVISGVNKVGIIFASILVYFLSLTYIIENIIGFKDY